MAALRTTHSFIINSLLSLSLSAATFAQPHKAATTENLPPGQSVLWSDPGDVEHLDLAGGPGGKEGRPEPPFSFVKEDLSGSSPKITVKDAKGRTWSVKWGQESMPDAFCTRLAWAAGYIVETDYVLPHGTIAGVHGLKRAKAYVGSDGGFSDGRFQLRSEEPKFLLSTNWAWNNNPFVGSQELNGLKILVMLVSNWDTKDARDINPDAFLPKLADSNLAILQEKTDQGSRYLYFMDDWGASLGRWGGPGVRSKHNCIDYLSQDNDLVRGAENGYVQWGYSGKHSKSITDGIRVEDVRWLMQYLVRLSDDQIRAGLTASGATPNDVNCYSTALRSRIDHLRRVSEGE